MAYSRRRTVAGKSTFMDKDRLTMQFLFDFNKIFFNYRKRMHYNFALRKIEIIKYNLTKTYQIQRQILLFLIRLVPTSSSTAFALPLKFFQLWSSFLCPKSHEAHFRLRVSLSEIFPDINSIIVP